MMRIRELALSLLLTTSGAAFGQTQLPAYDLDRLHLEAGAEGSLVVGNGRLLPEGTLRAGLIGQYANGASLTRTTDLYESPRIDRALSNLLLAYAPLQWLQVNAQIPFVLHQGAADLSSQGIAAPAGAGIGTPQLAVRVGLLQLASALDLKLDPRDSLPLDVAFEMGIGLPAGSPYALARDPRMPLYFRLMGGHDFGDFQLGAELNLNLQNQENFSYRFISNDESNTQTHEMGAAVAVSRSFMKGLRGELSARLSMALSNPAVTTEVLAGARYALDRNFEVFAAAGPAFGGLVGTTRFRALLGVAYGFDAHNALAATTGEGHGATSSSAVGTNDGAKDATAAKREPNETAKNLETPEALASKEAPTCEPGAAHDPADCPELDADSDGIANAQDLCPTQAEDTDGFEDDNGCPDLDNDKDGLADASDKCPNEQGVIAYEGCAAPALADRDNDGLLDEHDRCPDEAGAAELRGCPEKDDDGDGLANHLDNCVKEAGPKSNQGCPKEKEQRVIITRNELKILDQLHFPSGKTTLSMRSFVVLDQVGDILAEHPEIEKLVIEGHTDNRGSDAANRRISQLRAEAARNYLVSNGIDPERVEAWGFGPARPIKSNATAKGRRANRRVEFRIVQPKVPATAEPSDS